MSPFGELDNSRRFVRSVPVRQAIPGKAGAEQTRQMAECDRRGVGVTTEKKEQLPMAVALLCVFRLLVGGICIAYVGQGRSLLGLRWRKAPPSNSVTQGH